jgi:long-chain acyl-CoA synthetase
MDEIRVAARYEVSESDTAVDDVYRNAAEVPDHVVVSRQDRNGDWQPVTCGELADHVDAVASGLIAAGIAAGDRVALMSRTRYEWMIADFAIMAAGAVTVPIYETSSDAQIEWILTDSGAVAAFVEDNAHAARIRGLTPHPSTVWTLDGDLSELAADGLEYDGQLARNRRDSIRSSDLATIVYTSGTTGRPKGCALTHANLVATVRNVGAADGVRDFVFNDTQSTLLFLPLAHILARIIQLSAIYQRVRLGHLADMKSVPAGLQSFRPTIVLSVPRVFEKIYNTAQRSAPSGLKRRIFTAAERTALAYSEALDRAGASLGLELQHRIFDTLVYRKILAAMGGNVRWAVSGGAPLGATLGHFFRGQGVNVLEGYGLTETTAGGTLNLPGNQRMGSVGRPIPGCSIRIQSDGEILMKGPHVFAGYWQNPQATSEVIDEDGWFHTGDVGRIDDDGFVFITDRKKDIIVTSAGKNVAPTALEDCLRAHWLVSQAAVFGDRRPYVTALLTLDADALTAWQADHAKAHLPATALPGDPELLRELQEAVDVANAAVSQAEAIKRWSVLPTDFTESGGELTPTLKLKRNVIAQEFAAEVEALYDGVRAGPRVAP